jgi:hypothetical protein
MDPTNRIITQSKTHSVLQNFHLLPRTYYKRMEPNYYVYTTGPISCYFWSLQRKSYSCRNCCCQVMDPTKRSITQTKTNSVLQSLQLLPKTYYCRMRIIMLRMEPNHYVYTTGQISCYFWSLHRKLYFCRNS